MKKILIILERNLSTLPPMLAVIDSLVDLYEITFIIREHEESIERLYQSENIKFIAYHKTTPSNHKFYRGISRIRRLRFFKNQIPNIIKQGNFDLAWIATAETAVLLGKPLVGIKYIFSIYELYDVVPKVLKTIAPIAQNASIVIVPEFNRAYMLRFWLKLNETPRIIPNKPAVLPQPSATIPEQIEAFADKKVILYQGYINRQRNLDAICEAVSTMPDYVMILMGVSNDNYLFELKSKFPNIIHIGFIPPPFHLNITSHAYIGIVTYEFTDLNGVYCAPNKIWEYSGYGVPMLANNIPGLIYTVGNAGAGCCIDMNNSKTIRESIKKIEENYIQYARAAKIMFDSVDVKDNILSIVNDCIQNRGE